MERKNILITGGSHAELPLIDALHRLGYAVISTGTNRDGLGHRAADVYEPADFSDREEMLRLAEKYRVAGIVAGCNDFAYLSAAYAAFRLGLKGYDAPETAEAIHNKDRFRQLQRDCGIRHPRFCVCRSAAELSDAKEGLKLPVVVKPVDLTGGKGVEICRSWEEAERQFHRAAGVTRQARIIVEEYVTGENHGTSMLLKNGSVVFAFFDNEEYFKNKYLVSGAYSPSDLTEAQKADVAAQTEKLARYAHLCDGLFHCQFIVDPEGLPYLIDPCRRAPGDLYVKLVSYASGIDYPMAIVKGQLGLSMDGELAYAPADRCIARECIMAESDGVIKRIAIDPEYERHIIDRLQWLYPGDRIENHLTGKAGIVFFEYPSPGELRERMKRLYQHMRIEIAEG